MKNSIRDSEFTELNWNDYEIAGFRVNIMGVGLKPADQFQAHPNNPKHHPQRQRAAVKASLSKFGWTDFVLENNVTGNVLDGHERIWNALKEGESTLVPYVLIEIPKEQEPEFLIAFDRTGQMAEWDKGILQAIHESGVIEDMEDEFDILGLLNDEGIEIQEKPPGDVDPQIDRAEELREVWGVETGQLWQLGDHRLICGDCTDGDVVERVMGGEKASLVWTDPPYGVKYGDKLEAANPMGYRVRSIKNDDLPADQLEGFIRTAYILASGICNPGAAIYAACPAGTPLPIAVAAFIGSGFEFRWQLVWVKDQLVLSRADYHFRHENILYGWKPNAAHYFTDDRTQDSIFEVPRPKKSDEHPTMKPVELIAQMILNSSKDGEIVYEPFSGSGSTLIACEILKRKCRAIEISPAYVAVAIQRWVDVTGGTPELME